jgi:hypothetical protein
MAAPFRAICAFHHLGIRREFFLRIPRDCTSSELDRDVTKVDKGGEVFVLFEGTDGWVKAWFSGQKKGSPKITASKPDVLANLATAPIQLSRATDKRDFIDCVKSRTRTLQDAEVGHRTCSMCQLGHISIQLGGRAITWDPQKEFSPDAEVMKRTDRPEWRGHWMAENPRA